MWLFSPTPVNGIYQFFEGVVNSVARKKVLVAMSGGVDSSVAALLLVERGFEVAGVTMYFGLSASEKSIEDATSVCKKLGIPHHVLDYSHHLEAIVVQDFINQYRQGKTPNPCVVCNRYLKFGKLLNYAKDNGFDYLATGHYARIEEHGGKYFLKRPKDRQKDQTYFLYGIEPAHLPFILFPLSEVTKEEVRALATRASLPVAAKPQSQDICFLPQGDYRKFLTQRTQEDLSGFIVTSDGRVLGRHRGYFQYTIGQRKGLRVSGTKPFYVVAIQPERNEVVVGEREELKASSLIASSCNIFVEEFPARLFAQVRYLQKERPCSVEVLGSQKVQVIFEEEVEMVTPGQSVVFYSNDTVLGGGVIESVLK